MREQIKAIMSSGKGQETGASIERQLAVLALSPPEYLAVVAMLGARFIAEMPLEARSGGGHMMGQMVDIGLGN